MKKSEVLDKLDVLEPVIARLNPYDDFDTQLSEKERENIIEKINRMKSRDIISELSNWYSGNIDFTVLLGMYEELIVKSGEIDEESMLVSKIKD